MKYFQIRQSLYYFFLSTKGAFFVGGLLGGFIFILLYGINVLDVTHIDWLLYQSTRTDISQHYLGWAFYRNGEWMFPWGMTTTLSDPMQSSIIFTDSIPHLAFLFKILSPILPNTFQYFGLFGFLCFVFQGAISCLIIKKATNNSIFALIFSIFFILATPLSRRMFIHTALAAQCIILFALYIYLYKDKDDDFKTIILWSITIGIAAGTHITILAICCIILFFFTFKTIKQRKWWKSAIYITTPILFAVLILYCYGGLSSETNPVESANNGGGLGWYGVNLNMLINPIYSENSTLFPNLPISDRSSDDGYCYLGVGLLLLLLISASVTIYQRNLKSFSGSKLSILSIFGMVLVFFIIALSPRVTCWNHVLFEYHPPKLILWLWEVFRATGRFIWPIYYLILIGTAILIFKTFHNNMTILTLITCLGLIIQTIDILPHISDVATWTVTSHVDRKELSPQWESICNKKEKICFYYSDKSFCVLDYPELLQLASSKKLSLNTFHFAHNYEAYHKRIKSHAKSNCLHPNSETLYIFCNAPESFLDSCKENMTITYLDGYTLGTKK